MESRMDKYYRENNSDMQRSSKNAKLYREVYQTYNDLENLPIPDNTNEIDIPELRKIVQSQKQDLTKTREMKYHIPEDIPKEKTSNKIHDINKLLEYAKNENNKLKDNNSSAEDTSNYRILETLEDKNITKSDKKNSLDNLTGIPNKINDSEEQILDSNNDSTNELKYQTKKISENPSIEQIIPNDNKETLNTASLSLDILSDLKPTGNTGVTEPVKDPMFEQIYNDDVENIPENEDVNIIKDDIEVDEDNEEQKDSSFYTDTYKFTDKDFYDDDLLDESKNHTILKIILLIVFIALCGVAIFYFITNYGMN